MTEQQRHDILTRAVKTWGESSQVDIAIEEMAELTKALCKIRRARNSADRPTAIINAVEEIVDVQIMLDQLRIIYSRTVAKMEKSIEEAKLQRLAGRLDKHDALSDPKWAAHLIENNKEDNTAADGDKPEPIGGIELEDAAWLHFKITRNPGETDEELRSRCMAAADAQHADAPHE